jgi:hypothetical protein
LKKRLPPLWTDRAGCLPFFSSHGQMIVLILFIVMVIFFIRKKKDPCFGR